MTKSNKVTPTTKEDMNTSKIEVTWKNPLGSKKLDNTTGLFELAFILEYAVTEVTHHTDTLTKKDSSERKRYATLSL